MRHSKIQTTLDRYMQEGGTAQGEFLSTVGMTPTLLRETRVRPNRWVLPGKHSRIKAFDGVASTG